MRAITAIQADIDSTEAAIQAGGVDQNQIDLWNMQISDFRKEKVEVQQNEQVHAEKVQEVTESIMFEVDTMDFGGLSLMEIITNDGEYDLVREGFQNKLIQQAQEFLKQLNDLQIQSQTEIKQHVDRSEEREAYIVQCEQTINTLFPENFQLKLENEDIKLKRDNAISQLEEAHSQIEQQKTHISDLQTQIAIGVRGALNVIPVPQDTTKMKAEIMARKPRIMNARFKDEFGIDRKIKTAVEVLTGNEIEYEAIYEKRYIILNLEEAAQYRAEIEQKKAEEEAQNAVIPTIEQDIESVTEQESDLHGKSFLEDESEVQATDNANVQTDQGNEPVHTVVERIAEESEVVTRAEFDILSAKVEHIYRFANIPAVA